MTILGGIMNILGGMKPYVRNWLG